MVAWHQVALAGACAGALALERRAFLQAMFSRPLVAATAIGFLLGDLRSGLSVGMLLELYYLGSASLGAAVPDHDTLAATGTTAAAAALTHASGSGSTPAIWSVAILAFSWLGSAGRWLDHLLERYSARLAARALDSAQRGDLDGAMRQNLWAMWPHFAVFGAVTLLCGGAGIALAVPFERLPPSAVRGLAWAYPAMASVAAAIAARGSRAKRALAWAGASAALVAAGSAVWAFRGSA